MMKVLYNGEYIELIDDLEVGYKELDLLIRNDKNSSGLDSSLVVETEQEVDLDDR